MKPDMDNRAIKLQVEDFPQFLEFFITENPGSETDWLQEYFETIVKKGYAYGCFETGKLVSAGDLPTIPFMEDIIVETGICTLEEYRNKGYAKAVISNGLAAILKDGKVPIWACSYNNAGSNALAKSVGYLHFGDVITIEE
jgi:predicted GNAT family acetyltransferase